ncbi:MAG: hypothetical protein M3512_00750 [Bacteroidota bacterium]|nr:hypothetical protein [Bacteroidota bacterium]
MEEKSFDIPRIELVRCYFLASCDNTTSSETKIENGPLMNEIVGAYARDYSFEVKNMSTDQIIRIRSVRVPSSLKKKKMVLK